MADSNFVDYVKICCRSGAGGAGKMHFHRDKFTAKGGPDGGDGGPGGSVIIRGNSNIWTLLHLKFRKHIIAEPGVAGGSALKSGAKGEHAILDVPIGTVARDAETMEIVGEITHEGQELVLTAGGRGGQGNWHFKSPTNQTPRYAQPGEPGKEEWKILELKLLADVGLVGFPNAGKSTLLSVVSAAKPEIANYPFTTLVPNLGIVPYYDFQSFVMADIPGIIEGASEGKGLGLRFLRHIERNAVLLFMVPIDEPSIKGAYEILDKELEKYNPHLLNKKRILAITKCDISDSEYLEMARKEDLPIDLPVVFVSSLTGMNIQKLKDELWIAIQNSKLE